MVTQIVVIGVFFYRFKVDQEIVDLQDSINSKKEIIEVSQPLIKKAKTIAFKLQKTKEIIYDQQTLLAANDYILSRFPEACFLNKIETSDKTLTLKGYTQDLNILKAFHQRLKDDAKFQKIELVNIKKSDLGLEFTFELTQFNGVKSI